MENYTIQTQFDDDFVFIDFNNNDGNKISNVFIGDFKENKNNFIHLKNNLYNEEFYVISFMDDNLNGGFTIEKKNNVIEFSNTSNILYTVCITVKINKEIEKMLDEIIMKC